jgi:hypothetical protein
MRLGAIGPGKQRQMLRLSRNAPRVQAFKYFFK